MLYYYTSNLLWSSCILKPLYNLTGPVGQLRLLPAQGAAIHAPGVHSHFWNWDLLLEMSCYIADPDVIPDHWLRQVFFFRNLATSLATPLVPVPLTADLRDKTTHCQDPVRPIPCYWSGGGGGVGKPCGDPAFSHHYTVSLVQQIPFASRLVGQQFAPRECTYTSGTGISC